MYPFALIGNCQTAALVSNTGSVDWMCLPRPDSPPIFGKLLDPDGGHFSIEAMEKSSTSQYYLPNTNVLVTHIRCEDDTEFKITDFCPRFYQHGRIYRPNALFRIVEPVRGSSTIRVSCKPVNGWEKEFVKPIRGNSHLRFELRNEHLRLISNMPLTYLCEETPFSIKEPLHFGLTWSFGIEEDLIQLSNRFLNQTRDYWETWVKHCSIPTLYQEETIRSALTLKLHCYEDTGAILAALTTSLPEEGGSQRNWDYRFCWLRDAYFVLSALHNLGHFEEMEGFITFLLNIAEKHDHSRQRLRPVYRLDQTLPLPEIEHSGWKGYQLSSPVRSGNQAADHVQNDVYGEMILTLAPIFFDERFRHLRTADHEHLLEHLVRFCAIHISQPDSGPWELRTGWQEHSFSNLMCWAGIERAVRLKERGYLKNVEINLQQAHQKAEASVTAAIQDNILRNGPRDNSMDAALLQLAILRFPNETYCRETTNSISTQLQFGKTPELSSFLYRYLRNDDFGNPKSAFIVCSFWLVQAFAKTGQMEKAQALMKRVMLSATSLGLYSEHFEPGLRNQTGNFPQAYSHVGQINAAFSISPPWTDIL